MANKETTINRRKLKTKEQEEDSSAPRSAQQRLDDAFLPNRLHRFAGTSTPISELLIDVRCHECQRKMEPTELCLGVDYFSRCIDTAKCKKARA